MNEKEALLNKMHEEMQKSQPVSSTYGTTTPTNVDKDKEGQLWDLQRKVTTLKRQVFHFCNRQKKKAFNRSCFEVTVRNLN